MSYKSDVNTTVTRNVPEFNKLTGNVYESLVVIAKRANQISTEMKEELNSKLSEFNSTTDNLEEIFENKSKEREEIISCTLFSPSSLSFSCSSFLFSLISLFGNK